MYFFFSILNKKNQFKIQLPENIFNSVKLKKKKKKKNRDRNYNNGFNHKTGCECEPVRPNPLVFQKLEFGSSFSPVLANSDLHLVGMRGPTETSTAFSSSMFEELRNLSLIEPLNSFKNSKFFMFWELFSIRN